MYALTDGSSSGMRIPNHAINGVISWVDQCFKRSIDITLYEKQKQAIYQLLEKFYSQNGIRGVFQMPTGAGKTIVAAGLIMALYRLKMLETRNIVLYLTPRKVLKDQVEDRFEDIFQIFETPKGLPIFRVDKPESDMVGWLKFFLEDWAEDSILIVIITPNALHDFVKKFGEEIYRFRNIEKIRLVLMDEVHRVYFGPKIFDSIRKLIHELSPKCIIGLSATPIKQAIDNIGPILYHLSSLDAMREGILVKKLKIYSTRTHVKLLERADKDEWCVAVIERAEAYADEILKKLSDVVRDVYGLQVNTDPLPNRVPKTLIVAANTTEANEIAKSLRKRISERRPDINVNELVRVAHYKIEESLKEIKEFKEQDQGILVTVNMADMGFDDPNLEVLVIARPIRTHIGYVQIRGRVLRKPTNTLDNIKASKYAILIDLTDAARHEEFVEKVELGEFAVKNLEEIESDLKGKGEVDKVHGKVTIKPQYKIIEIPPESAPQPAIPIYKIKKEILKILRLPHGLSTAFIKDELTKRGFNISLIDVEKACKDLVKDGKLIRRHDTWFYRYDARINDILLGKEERCKSLSEFMQKAGIPLKDQLQIVRLIYDIISKNPDVDIPEMIRAEVIIREGPAKLLIISKGLKKEISLKDLNNCVQRVVGETNWIIIRYSPILEQGVKSHLDRIEDLRFFDIKERWVSESMKEILLKRKKFSVIIKAQGYETICSDLKEIADFLRSHRAVEIDIPLAKNYGKIETIITGVIKIARKYKFKATYDFDEKYSVMIVRLRKR